MSCGRSCVSSNFFGRLSAPDVSAPRALGDLQVFLLLDLPVSLLLDLPVSLLLDLPVSLLLDLPTPRSLGNLPSLTLDVPSPPSLGLRGSPRLCLRPDAS